MCLLFPVCNLYTYFWVKIENQAERKSEKIPGKCIT